MCLFSSNVFLSSSVTALFYNPLLGAFLPRFTEMARKQPCFPLNTKSIEQRLGLYKSSSLPAMGYCLSLNFIMFHLAFCWLSQHWRHIIGPWHRILKPPFADVLREREQRGNFTELCCVSEYQKSPPVRFISWKLGCNRLLKFEVKKGQWEAWPSDCTIYVLQSRQCIKKNADEDQTARLKQTITGWWSLCIYSIIYLN